MPQYVVVRRRPGNAGIVRNIAAGVVGGLVAGYRAVVPGVVIATPATAQPPSPPLNPAPASVQQSPAPAPKTFTEAEVDDNYEEIEDVIVRYMTNPDYSDDTRKAFVQFLGEFNRTFRGE